MEKLFLASSENLMSFGDDVLTYFMLENFPKLPKKIGFTKNAFSNRETIEIYRDDAGQYFWAFLPFYTYPGYFFHPAAKDVKTAFSPLEGYYEMVNVIRPEGYIEATPEIISELRRYRPADGNIYTATIDGLLVSESEKPLLCNAAVQAASAGRRIEVALLGGGCRLKYRQAVYFDAEAEYMVMK